jgi:hypothetical protein
MNDIEDALREAMDAHDTLAPTTADFRFWTTKRRRRSPRLAVVAASACVLVIATLALLVSHRAGSAPAPAARHPAASVAASHRGNLAPVAAARSVAPIRNCSAGVPARAPLYWMPQPPKGIDVAKRLVPLETPTHAIVCAHHGRPAGPRTLGSAQLSTIAADLAWLPPLSHNVVCAASATMPVSGYVYDYLMALSYRHGTMWLAIPGNGLACPIGTSNGKFLAPSVWRQADAAFRTSRWIPRSTPIVAGCPQGAGRLGQQNRFVPAHPVSVQLCRQGKHSRTVAASRRDLARLVAELNGLPTTPQGYAFQCGPAGVPSQDYVLSFGYRAGPPVRVQIHQGCRPEISNGNLQAASASSVLPLIHQLLGPP